MKKINTEKSNKEVKDSNLKELMSLWLHESANKTKYLTGTADDVTGKFKVVGFFNTNKKNENEPDIRVYEEVEKGQELKEVLVSLWKHTSKGGTDYMTGKDNEDNKVVAFLGKDNEEKRPYVRIYTQGEEE